MSDNVRIAENIKAIIQSGGFRESKLTDWADEPTVETLKSDINNAQSFHAAQMSKIDEWDKLLHCETNKASIKKGRSGVAPKVIRRLAEWRYGALSTAFLNEKHLFHVNAYAPEYLFGAVQNELVLNFQFNALIDKVKFINDLVRSAVNTGTAIVRVGWETETQTKEYEEPVYQYVTPDPEQYQMLLMALQQIDQEMQQTQVETPNETQTFQELPEDFQESLRASSQYGRPVIAVNTGETQIVKEEVVTKNRPSVKVIPNSSLIIDPSCEGDFSQARFAVYKFTTSYSELKSQGIYKNLDAAFNVGVADLQMDSTFLNQNDEIYSRENLDKINSFNFSDKARKRVTAYEYWGYYDIDKTGIVQAFVATIVGNTVIRMERSPFPDNKLPFVVIPYLPVLGSVYGEPDGELVKDNQQIITALTRAMIDINARSANAQVATPKGFLDSVNADKFNRGEDYQYNPIGMHPSEAIFMHTANEVPASIMGLLQQHYAEAEAATGVKAFQQGIDGNAYGQVVQGMSQAITAMTQRESDILFRLSQGLKEVGNKIVAMNAIWLSEEETIAITQNEFQTIRREDLAGDFYLDVSVKSNSESEGKAQQLTFLMQTLGNNIPFDLTKIFLVEISRLYNLDTITNLIQKYEPQPDPIEQQRVQTEMAEAEARVAKLRAEEEYFLARSNFIQAQMGQVQADTDQRNLDFLEQKEGITHERQREIVEAQANAQNRGKIAQELIKGHNSARVADIKAQEAKAKAAHQAKNKSGNKSSGSKPKVKINRQTGLLNPEYRALPRGLHIADGLGNYIRGDNQQ